MIGTAITIFATPAFARSIELKDSGTAIWIFLIVGALIVLLQLVPAAILFFSFIGSTAYMAFKNEKKFEEKMIIPAVGPETVKS